ncbi:MAG: SDR family oxidoreductase [Bacteroidota bacterium]|jgi:dehydrogenase/reductase SDR family member 7B
MSEFKDKVVWITGASSGIGEALVKKFASLGSKIILSARNSEELNRVAKEASLHESRFLILPFDLADTSNAVDLLHEILHKFGRIDILINNGGFSQRAEAMKTDMKMARKLMEVNYFAPVALTNVVLPEMIKNGQGQIVVISSIAGKFGFFLRSSYSAAKHALHGYFESLRLETEGKGIKVLIVCPGKIKTNISLNAVSENETRHGKMDPSHKNAMSAEDCAEEIKEGIKNSKEEIFIGGKELRAIWVKRFFPSIFSRAIRKQNPL